MSVVITQTCDRCKQSRTLDGNRDDQVKKDGWRRLPVRGRFGDWRIEQPTLCPECLEAVAGFIDAGVKV